MLSSLLVALCLFNCTPSYDVAVNAFAGADATANRRFIVIPAMPDVPPDDLLFQEVQRKVSAALVGQGFAPAGADDADLAVLVGWTSETSTESRTVNDPIYGYKPSGSGTATITPGFGNTADVKIKQDSTYGVTGYAPRTVTERVTVSKLSLIATDFTTYRKTRTIRRLWTMDLVTKGGDMRAVTPVVLSVGAPYFGRSTGQAIQIKVKETDPGLVALRAAP